MLAPFPLVRTVWVRPEPPATEKDEALAPVWTTPRTSARRMKTRLAVTAVAVAAGSAAGVTSTRSPASTPVGAVVVPDSP